MIIPYDDLNCVILIQECFRCYSADELKTQQKPSAELDHEYEDEPLFQGMTLKGISSDRGLHDF